MDKSKNSKNQGTVKSIIAFFDTEYKSQAQNKNYQSIASCIDGLKPTQRKIIHTALKKNITNWTKVEVMANITAGETEYLGGASNISGVIVNISKSYVGSKNLPLLDTKGNFGQRLDNKPGEPRYIFIRKNKTTDEYFNKVDQKVLIEQDFEGAKIEPKFFVPTLPLLLINGSEGMGSGHAQNILPRSIKSVKKSLAQILKGEKVSIMKPHWNGFEGTVKQGDSKSQWITTGKYTVDKNFIKITELPIGYNLNSYIKKLDKLIDTNKIKSYTDNSNTKTDKFYFTIRVDKNFDKGKENIEKTLLLTSRFGENYTSIDEDNKIVLFDTAEDLLRHYVEVKKEYLNLRKEYLIQDTEKVINLLVSKFLFIKNIVDENIIINKKKKDNIIKQIEDLKEERIIQSDGSYDYLLNMAIYNLTNEKMASLKEKIIQEKKNLKEIKNKTIEETWLEEVECLKD